jgi:hypothetical protein
MHMTVRTLVSAANPVFADAGKKTVALDVVFAELASYGAILFVATPDDPEPHGPAILQRAIAGEFGVIGAFVEPVKLKA